MASELPTTNGHSANDGENNFAVKAGLARMLKGGVIMDVINAEQVRKVLIYPLTSPILPSQDYCYDIDFIFRCLR